MLRLEQVVPDVNPAALRVEIAELERLIDKRNVLCSSARSREVETKLGKLRDVIAEQGIFRDPKMKLLAGC